MAISDIKITLHGDCITTPLSVISSCLIDKNQEWTTPDKPYQSIERIATTPPTYQGRKLLAECT
jgi:hypothetical protein